MANTTTANVMTAGSLGEMITREAIRVFESNLYFAKMGTMAKLPLGYNKYTFPTVDQSVAAAALTEGTTPSEGTFRITNVEVTLTQFGGFAILSDVLLTDAPVDVVIEASVEAARQVAKKFDVDVQDVIDAGTNVIYGGDATSRAEIAASDTMAATLLAKSVNLLRSNDAPTFEGGYYAAIMHPHVFHDLQVESGTGTYIDLHKYDTPEALFKGETGALYGARILVSSNVQFFVNGGDANVDAYPTYVFGQKAYGVVMSGDIQAIFKATGSAGTADPLEQRATVAGKIRGKAAILKQAALYRIETSSSLGAN